MKINRNLISNKIALDSMDRLHHCQSEKMGVMRAAGEYRLVATCPMSAGEPLFRMEGEVTTRPSRYSVQIGENLHIDLGEGHGAEAILDRYFWRFMNHSCNPNALIRDREVIASRDIHLWEAVTFNYNTTEWDMAAPFHCQCGTLGCLGKIQGFKHLTPKQREQLDNVAPYLSRYALTESPKITELALA